MGLGSVFVTAVAVTSPFLDGHAVTDFTNLTVISVAFRLPLTSSMNFSNTLNHLQVCHFLQYAMSHNSLPALPFIKHDPGNAFCLFAHLNINFTRADETSTF